MDLQHPRTIEQAACGCTTLSPVQDVVRDRAKGILSPPALALFDATRHFCGHLDHEPYRGELEECFQAGATHLFLNRRLQLDEIRDGWREIRDKRDALGVMTNFPERFPCPIDDLPAGKHLDQVVWRHVVADFFNFLLGGPGKKPPITAEEFHPSTEPADAKGVEKILFEGWTRTKNWPEVSILRNVSGDEENPDCSLEWWSGPNLEHAWHGGTTYEEALCKAAVHAILKITKP